MIPSCRKNRDLSPIFLDLLQDSQGPFKMKLAFLFEKSVDTFPESGCLDVVSKLFGFTISKTNETPVAELVLKNKKLKLSEIGVGHVTTPPKHKIGRH